MTSLPVTFEVTAGHIRAGERESCRRDPVALALAEACGASVVEAFPDMLYVRVQHRRRRRWFMAQTPPVVTAFMDSFDTLGPVRCRPFTFTVTGWERARQLPWARDLDWLAS